MTPREIDALVATHVFGCNVRRGVAHSDGNDMPWEVWDQPHGGTLNPVRYSFDLIAAFQVVEKLMASHFMASVNCSRENGWWCVLYPESGAVIEVEYAQTAPMAICLAALKALGVEIDP